MAVIRKAYRITEQAMIDVFNGISEGQIEWEIEARAHATMRRMGAEGTSYPIWVCSGPNTHQSLCRSTNRRIRRNELVQLTFGARYNWILIGRSLPGSNRPRQLIERPDESTTPT